MGGVSDLHIDAQNLREDFKRYSRMNESFEDYLKRIGRSDIIEIGIGNEFAEGIGLHYKKGGKIKAKKAGGKVKSYKKGGKVRGAGIAQRGTRKCRMR